jgi:hypothetical protein
MYRLMYGCHSDWLQVHANRTLNLRYEKNCAGTGLKHDSQEKE